VKPKQLLEGTVTTAHLKPETVTKPVTRVVKTTMVTRNPGERIAIIEMALRKGKVELEIDEATARAIAKVFD
jgi:hypothetical protein